MQECLYLSFTDGDKTGLAFQLGALLALVDLGLYNEKITTVAYSGLSNLLYFYSEHCGLLLRNRKRLVEEAMQGFICNSQEQMFYFNFFFNCGTWCEPWWQSLASYLKEENLLYDGAEYMFEFPPSTKQTEQQQQKKKERRKRFCLNCVLTLDDIKAEEETRAKQMFLSKSSQNKLQLSNMPLWKIPTTTACQQKIPI
jgi:hypothetical protein